MRSLAEQKSVWRTDNTGTRRRLPNFDVAASVVPLTKNELEDRIGNRLIDFTASYDIAGVVDDRQ